MRRSTSFLAFAAALCAALIAGRASAATTVAYTIDGANGAQRAQIRAALAASRFDWSVIPVKVAVHVVRGVPSHAGPGHVWLDPALLDTGRFSWAVIQDEFAHQVDFFRLDDTARDSLNRALGTSVWCHADLPGLPHAAYGCERFSSSLVWAYWPDADNAYRPTGRDSEALADTARFRAVLESALARAA